MLPSTAALLAIVLCFQSPSADKRAEAVRERVATILRGASDDDAIRRRAAVEKLVDVGPEAVSALDPVLTRGNQHVARTAAIALGEIGTLEAGQVLAAFLKDRSSATGDMSVAVVAAIALGACPGPKAEEALFATVEGSQHSDFVRLAAAIGLARRRDRTQAKIENAFTAISKRVDADPEVAGALAVALGASARAAAASRLAPLLKDARDPAARAGLWLGIAMAGGGAVVPSPQVDVDSGDPVLARCAVLGSRQLPVRSDSSAVELREARIVSVAVGAGDDSILALAPSEADPTLRPLWYGAAAERGWSAPLLDAPWAEQQIGDAGRFAAAAWMAWRDGFTPEERRRLDEQARKAVAQKDDATAVAGILLLGALGNAAAAELLEPQPKDSLARASAARLARKWLRAELDRRRFELALRAHAARERVLLEGWMSDACVRYAATLVGQGSDYFSDRTGFAGKPLLPPGMSRRKRALPPQHAAYADLWSQLQRFPFDVQLVFPRDDNN